MSDGDGHTCYLFDGIPYTVIDMRDWLVDVQRDWRYFAKWLACGMECYVRYKGFYTFQRFKRLCKLKEWTEFVYFLDDALREFKILVTCVAPFYIVNEESETVDVYMYYTRDEVDRLPEGNVMESKACYIHYRFTFGQEPMFEVSMDVDPVKEYRKTN